MRDVDFVPFWYRDLLRRKRSTTGYLLVLGFLVILVGGGAFRRLSEIRAAERELTATEAALGSTRGDLQKLDALRQLRDQWRRQEQVLTSTGVNMEASRLLAALTKVVPIDTVLTGINFAVAEPDHDPAPTTAPSASNQIDQSSARQPGKRRLNVSLRGIAPGEVAVANVLAGISKQPLFRHVNLTYAKDRQEQDTTVREFEVTFVINLDPDATVDDRD